jgi:hypothetical protein
MHQREVVAEGISGKWSRLCRTRTGEHDWRLILVQQVSGIDQCGLCYEHFGKAIFLARPQKVSDPVGLMLPTGFATLWSRTR